MLRNSLSTGCCMLGLLLFVMPASASDFTETTTIDLTTLRFSGIGTTFTPQTKLTEAFVIGRSPDGRDAVSRQVLVEQDGHWADHTFMSSPGQQGTAVALMDSTRFMVSSTLTSAQSVGSDVWGSGELRATEAGTLTVSVQYTMSHSGIPTNLTNFIAQGGPMLVVGDRTVLVRGGDIHTNGTETGTLSVSRDFTQGEVITVIVGAREVASVSVPGMLWPTLGMMVGIVCIVARRRSPQRFS